MSPLKVPESGLHLQAGNDSSLPPQAFAVNLNSSIVEGLINCVKNGGRVSLDLGSTPTLNYGSKSHRISPPRDSAPFDIFLTRPFESTRNAERLPNTSSLFKKLARPTKPRASQAAAADPKRNLSASSKGSASSGIDSDMEVLKNELAAHDAARERAHVVDKMPSTKKVQAKTKAKLFSSYGSAPRSMPTSPALNGINSPSTSTLTNSEQLMERLREQRSPLVHELASRDRTEQYLRDKWRGSAEDFKHILDKVSEYLPEPKTYALKTMYWKELNVWEHDYDTQEDRQLAIDNAIRRYDKQRLGPSEPEWQKLLPEEERGKGKCLSKLQARLNEVPAQAAPKIKVQKADDSSSSKDDGNGSSKSKSGGAAMSRSSSNSLPTKAKKPSQEAQTKKTMNPKARSAVQKPSPTKAKATNKANGGRVLSQAIIENSDSSGDEATVQVKPTPVAKPKPAPKARDTVVVKQRPVAREPIKPQPMKRPREEESDSSSSSGTPLAHRLPNKQTRPVKPLKQRPVDSSQSSRVSAASSQPVKNKNTSPIKSSPLASSPPTNASDLDDGPPVPKKRKADEATKRPVAKRQTIRAVPNEVVDKAHTFKLYYQKYEALHYEISALDNPPNQKVEDLLDMRNRLQDMKKEIYKRYASDRE